MHRAHFLDELVKSVPTERAHFNKRVVTLENQCDGSVLVRFKNGTAAAADAVIVADGVHSSVRAHLLGEELAKPVFAGSAVYRALVVGVLGAFISLPGSFKKADADGTD